VVVQDHDVVVASVGGDWELASLVHVDLPQWFHNGSKASMRPTTIRHWIRWVAVREILSVGVFGGLLILTTLVLVALVHYHGHWQESP